MQNPQSIDYKYSFTDHTTYVCMHAETSYNALGNKRIPALRSISIETNITELSATHGLVCSCQDNSDMLKSLYLRIFSALCMPGTLSKLSTVTFQLMSKPREIYCLIRIYVSKSAYTVASAIPSYR